MAKDPKAELGAVAIERAMAVSEQMKDLSFCDQAQARQAVTEFTFAHIAGGERDEQPLVVSALTHLKQLERAVGSAQ
ncbi:hypothetical protein [Bradyrhizobium sp. McL0616]|uniref:hypothetical protein n=1 Tax=Bradyrhizobium sp. McL0616 TaxID=3415674 RepID=UPI003CF2DFBA